MSKSESPTTIDSPQTAAHGLGDRHRSAWSTRSKMARVLWMLVQATLFRWSFHNWYGWRRWLLRCFGATIGARVRVRPTARIEIPWHLHLGDDCAIGDYAILYSLGEISIGHASTVSQYAHLCAGTHDYTRVGFPLVTAPIRVGSDVWIAADAFVRAGVTVGDRSIVAARATVVHDVEADQIVGGNPARFIKQRPPLLP